MPSPSISTARPVRVLVVGLGTMGTSHARAYSAIDEFELAGLCTSRAADRHDLDTEFRGVPRFERYDEALATVRPDAVAICTYTEHHATMALQAIAAGAHVFCEKPLADTLEAAKRVVSAARASGKALVVGYILRVHPSWSRFVEIGRTLGKPLVMRMNLNQQSAGSFWEVHKKLMLSTSPIVDCGVHYVDIMCQVTRARPVMVHAVGARLTDEIAPEMYNYGHLHIVFEDGSVGWYEVGWGPMMSETAHFVKDIIGPNGSLSMVAKESTDAMAGSADHDTHTRTNALRIHHAVRNSEGGFARPDEILSTEDEPGHQELCEREQRLFLQAIRGAVDLSEHHEAAINSLGIVFAADASVRTGEVVRL
jgi:predicted dehydrogenase